MNFLLTHEASISLGQLSPPLKAAPAGHSGGKRGAGEAVLGILLTLFAMLILAGRLVSEEIALEGMDMHPLQVTRHQQPMQSP